MRPGRGKEGDAHMKKSNESLREIGHQELCNWSRWCWTGAMPGPGGMNCASLERQYATPHYELAPGEGYCKPGKGKEEFPPEAENELRPLPVNHDRARAVDAIYQALPLIEQRIVQAEYTRRHEFDAETRKARMEEASAKLKISPVYFATALGQAQVAVGRALR
jgi:hypothetical protein